jgi:coenzyme F420 hydrogenase subunit beta
MKGNRGLIAFDDLNQDIITQGFCTLCGACEAACPIHAIRIVENKLNYDDCSSFIDLCPICYDICPHTEPLLLEAMKFVADAPMRRNALGSYREIVLAQATDPKIRELSHSGGVVTTILAQAMEDGMIDSAITSEAEAYAPLKLKPQINLVPDDVLSAVDSKFSPSSVAKAFGNAVREYGKAKIAFVGVPHQVLAIRKLEAWEHKIMGSLQVTIGLFCLWVFSLNQLLGFLKKEYGIQHKDIIRMDLTDEYDVYTSKGCLKVPLDKVMFNILNKCKTCMDFTSELADISIGGASPLKDWSAVIIRTKKGESIFRNALDNGVIRVTKIEEQQDVIAHLLLMATHKKKIALDEVKRLRSKGVSLPPIDHMLTFLQRETLIMAQTKVKDIMTKKVLTVSPQISVSQLLDMMTKHHHMGYPVVNEKDDLVGIVTFEDVMKVPKEKRGEVLVHQIIKRKLVTAYPDDSALEAFEKMNKYEIGRILIIDPQNSKKLYGVLTRTDIMHAIGRAGT